MRAKALSLNYMYYFKYMSDNQQNGSGYIKGRYCSEKL